MSSSVGLYLGTGSVDLVQLTGSFGHPRLVRWASSAAGDYASEEAMVGSLRTLLSREGLDSSRVHVAVASEAVVIRYFQMPTIPPHERKSAISFEAKKYLPFKLEELLTDFQVVLHRADPALMRVMFFGIKRNSLQTILSSLKAVNLVPLSVEVAPLSLLRLLRQTGQLSAAQVAALLLLERDSATISVTRGDLIYLSRNVAVVGPDESSEQKGPEGEEGPSPALWEALTSETRVSIDYYRRRFLGEPAVGKVILYGKELHRKRMAELSSALDLPVEVGDPYAQMTVSRDLPTRLAVAAGLALRGLEKREGQANLLPSEYRRDLEGLLKPVILELASVLLLLGLGYGLTLSDLNGWRQRILDLKDAQARSSLFRPGISLSDLQTSLENQTGRIRFLEKLSEGRREHVVLLSSLARLLPPEAWLQYARLEDTLQRKVREQTDSLPMERRHLLQLKGGSFMADRDKELEGIHRFFSALRADPAFQAAFPEFHVDSLQKGLYQEEEVTEFQFTCASRPEDLREETGRIPHRRDRL